MRTPHDRRRSPSLTRFCDDIEPLPAVRIVAPKFVDYGSHALILPLPSRSSFPSLADGFFQFLLLCQNPRVVVLLQDFHRVSEECGEGFDRNSALQLPDGKRIPKHMLMGIRQTGENEHLL